MHTTRTHTSQIDDISAVKAFIVLQASGGFGMLFLLSSAFISQIKAVQRLKVNVSSSSTGPINRSRTWYSFCISWIISCFSYCLLFIANKQFDEKSSYGLCMVQAALIYSSPPLTGGTTFALFLDVWWMFRASKGDRSGGRAVMNSLLVAPYMFWIILTIGFLVDGFVNPQVVEQDLAVAPYCVLNQPFPPTFVSSITLAFGAAVLVMLVILIKATYKIHTQTSQSSSHPSRSFVRSGDDNSMRQYTQILSLISRLIAFGILGLIVVLISVVFVLNRAVEGGLDSATAAADLTMAGLPLGGVAIFGTQKDFFQLWSILFKWPLWRFRRGTHDATYKEESPRLLRQDSIAEMEVLSDVLDISNEQGDFLPFPRDVEEALTVSPRKVYYS